MYYRLCAVLTCVCLLWVVGCGGEPEGVATNSSDNGEHSEPSGEHNEPSESDDGPSEPDDGHSEPGDEHSEPGDEHSEPGDEHSEPGDEHSEPGDEHSEPGDEHSEPGDEHSEPGDEHSEPGDEHSEPGDEHNEPGDEHNEPGDEHSEPGDEHSEPGDEHSEPGDEHSEPGDGHSEPGDEHSEPGDEHSEPGDEHSEPSDEHSEPGDGGQGPTDDSPSRKPVVRPRTLADDAEQAFRQGRDRDAFQLLQAHAVIADDEAATELLNKMGWINILKRPSFAVRWAVGVHATVARGYSGGAFPIGDPQNLPPLPGVRRVPVKTGNGGTATPDETPKKTGWDGTPSWDRNDEEPVEGEANVGGQGVNLPEVDPFLQQAAGELAQRFVQQYTLRAERGDFGEVLKTSAAFLPPAVFYSSEDDGYSGSPDTDSESDWNVEESSESSGEHSESSGEHSESGGGQYDESSGGGYQDSGGGSGGNAAGGVPAKPRQVARGLVLVGMESYKELLERAKGLGANVLVVFDVTIKASVKSPIVQNETEIVVYDVASGKKVCTTKDLNNVEVQRAREKGEDGGVDREMRDLFKYIDQNWLLMDLPAMQPEHAQGRVKSLISDPDSKSNPVPVLAEVRMFHSRELLETEELHSAYQSLLGAEKGTALATGPEEVRKQVLSRWLPRSR